MTTTDWKGKTVPNIVAYTTEEGGLWQQAPEGLTDENIEQVCQGFKFCAALLDNRRIYDAGYGYFEHRLSPEYYAWLLSFLGGEPEKSFCGQWYEIENVDQIHKAEVCAVLKTKYVGCPFVEKVVGAFGELTQAELNEIMYERFISRGPSYTVECPEAQIGSPSRLAVDD